MITISTGRTARFIKLQKQSRENRMEVQLMGIRKCNGEGYHDPTTYEALSNIRKEEKAAKRAYRPLVYICSPFAGDTGKNMEKARHYCRFAVLT